MKIFLVMLTVAVAVGSCKQRPADTIQVQNRISALGFTGYEWQVKSVVTDPAILDTDGDEELDAEIFGPFQEAEKNKRIIFEASGEVFEKREKRNTAPGEYEIVRNGCWEPGKNGGEPRWIQEDNRVCTIDPSLVPDKKELHLTSVDDSEIKITVILSASKEKNKGPVSRK